MNKNFCIEIIFIILLFLFGVYNYSQNQANLVLKVFSPTMFAVDLNRNRHLETEEIVCLSGVKFFGETLNDFDCDAAKEFDVTQKDALSLLYLAKDFAEFSLSNKFVKFIADEEQTNPNCITGDILIAKKSFRSSLLNGGFAYSDVYSYNKEKFLARIAEIKKFHPVILNRKSKKYHEVDCKYGRVIEDYTLLMREELPENVKPCRLCFQEQNENNSIIKKVFPDRITDGSFRIFLTDMTNNLKVKSDCSTGVCQAFLEEIKNAQETIDIATYGWVSVKEIDDAIIDAVKRGVRFRLVYDFSKKNYYPETTNIARYATASKNDFDGGSSKNSEYLMHNKFIVFDGKKVATGSLNYSKTDFSGFNSNFIAFINSPEIAAVYTAEFEQMLAGNFHGSKQKINENNSFKIDNSKVEIYFSPQDKIVVNQVIKYIDNAKEYVYIPAFVVTHKAFEAALLRAKNRGVDIKLIVDATNVFTTNSIVHNLRKKGIPVKVENFAGKLHSKSIIVDDKYILAGSMNFSNSGENRNDENMLIIENPRFAIFYRDYFKYLWEKIPDKYLTTAPRAESLESIGSCFDGIDNDFDGRIDKADEACVIK